MMLFTINILNSNRGGPGIDSNPISIYKEHIIPDVSIVPSFLQYQYVTKYVINEEFSATIA
jgi:hypothetical protein